MAYYPFVRVEMEISGFSDVWWSYQDQPDYESDPLVILIREEDEREFY